uniref:Uncharacterized protein n=1 Tax=Salix viminalis TaxID=40686 RepID=A0A6N2L870_SALVM
MVIAMKIAKGKGAARTEKKEVSLPVEDRKIGKRKATLNRVYFLKFFYVNVASLF